MEKEDLFKYNTDTEEATFLYRKHHFIRLIEYYINDVINFNQFEFQYSLVFRRVQNEVRINRERFPEMKKFEPSENYRFSTSLYCIYRCFEEIEDEIRTEYGFEIYVKEIYFKILKNGVL